MATGRQGNASRRQEHNSVEPITVCVCCCQAASSIGLIANSCPIDNSRARVGLGYQSYQELDPGEDSPPAHVIAMFLSPATATSWRTPGLMEPFAIAEIALCLERGESHCGRSGKSYCTVVKFGARPDNDVKWWRGRRYPFSWSPFGPSSGSIYRRRSQLRTNR